MDETRMGGKLTLDAQALLLLDHPQNSNRRQDLENFTHIETCITHSLEVIEKEPVHPAPVKPSQPAAAPLTMAARLTSHRYEERAKSDALLQALKTLRDRNRSFRSSGKVIHAK